MNVGNESEDASRFTRAKEASKSNHVDLEDGEIDVDDEQSREASKPETSAKETVGSSKSIMAKEGSEKEKRGSHSNSSRDKDRGKVSRKDKNSKSSGKKRIHEHDSSEGKSDRRGRSAEKSNGIRGRNGDTYSHDRRRRRSRSRSRSPLRRRRDDEGLRSRRASSRRRRSSKSDHERYERHERGKHSRSQSQQQNPPPLTPNHGSQNSLSVIDYEAFAKILAKLQFPTITIRAPLSMSQETNKKSFSTGPETMIDASINSHSPMKWKLRVVGGVKKPDYPSIRQTLMAARMTALQINQHVPQSQALPVPTNLMPFNLWHWPNSNDMRTQALIVVQLTAASLLGVPLPYPSSFAINFAQGRMPGSHLSGLPLGLRPVFHVGPRVPAPSWERHQAQQHSGLPPPPF